MKKLLFNHDRTKIFNLDHLVSIERYYDPSEKEVKGIILKFSSEDYFIITPGNHIPLKTHFQNWIGYRGKADKEIFNCMSLGNVEENKKLYEYFEHKFTRSPLCANTELNA